MWREFWQTACMYHCVSVTVWQCDSIWFVCMTCMTREKHTQVAVLDFDCTCSAGYTGRTCEEDYDECLLQSPCRNGGYCVNNFGGERGAWLCLPWEGKIPDHVTQIEDSLGSRLAVVGCSCHTAASITTAAAVGFKKPLVWLGWAPSISIRNGDEFAAHSQELICCERKFE